MIGLAALLALAPAPSAAADRPRGLLTRLYACSESGNLNPIPRQDQDYAPDLARQMQLDVRLHGDEVGLDD